MTAKKSISPKASKRTARSYRPQIEQLEPRIAMHGAGIEVESAGRFQPLDGSIVSTTTPNVRITLPAEHLGRNVRIFLDDLDPDTPREDITDLFPALDVVGVGSAKLDLELGTHSIHVRAGGHSAEATMLNTRQEMLVVSSPVSNKFEYDRGLDTRVEKGTLLLNFQNDTSLELISNFLNDEGLTPLEIISPLNIVRVAIPKTDDPVSLAEELTNSNFRFLESASPNIALSIESIDVEGESMPRRLTRTYDASDGGFDDQGPKRTNEIHIARQHFYMDTFASHRLVERLVGSPTNRDVAVAVIDTGFGTKGTPNPTDIPSTDIVRPTLGEQMNIGPGGVQERTRSVELREINDSVDPGHGTAVAAAVAGRGTATLGIGRDLKIRPIKPRLAAPREPELMSGVAALTAAANDPAVYVINTSWGGIPEVAQNLFQDVARLITTNNKVWVAALGNSGTNRNLPFPAALAPAGQAPRSDTDYTLMAVSSTGTFRDTNGPELLAEHSNFGPVTSVSALGDSLMLPGRNGTIGSFNGTSFAAPLVSGLAGEMIYTDLNFSPNSRLTTRQIIEMIEATADDLGSSVEIVERPKPNNLQGNGRDDLFGHGRINAWKAILGIANRGIASAKLIREPGPNVGQPEFPSLTVIEEAATQWYGFKIRTNTLGATAWIDGQQLVDTGAAIPSTPNITAYAGVQPHVHSDTSDRGILPIGTVGGEYVMTFSIRREDLVNGDTPRTLSLRVGNVASEPAYFNLPLDLESMRNGQMPGVSFDDFVFEITPADFGDAPDALLSYASSGAILSNGARHLNSNYEWLGTGTSRSSVSSEVNANAASDPDGVPNIKLLSGDLDRFDDGVRFFPMTYQSGATDGILELSVSVASRTMGQYEIVSADTGERSFVGGRYADIANRSLYVNAWIDWNGNGLFEEDNDEHVVNGLRLNPQNNFAIPSGTVGVTRLNPRDRGTTANFRASFKVGTMGADAIHSRVRLDYGENAGRNTTPPPVFAQDSSLSLAAGAAQFGEVEDYRISVDFGDAKDPFTTVAGSYPTKRSAAPARDGARHLDTTREWIGAKVTREFNTDGATAADADGTPNLGIDGTSEDRDVGDDATVRYDGIARKLNVSFRVSTEIADYGFDHGTDAPIAAISTTGQLNEISLHGVSPSASRGKGRYDGTDPKKRIYVDIWSDWNGNGSWDDAGEHVLANAPVAPELFGRDGFYTLGDNFEDRNGNGVYEAAIDGFDPSIHDIAGVSSQAFSIDFPVPGGIDVAPKFYVRTRLRYGEPTALASDQPPAHSIESSRRLDGPRGAALFGEVEDHAVFTGSIRGQKWQDFKPNGIHDLPEEPGLNGWTITLFAKSGPTLIPVATQLTRWIDVNGNGMPEPPEMGLYAFENLAPGVYVVGEGTMPMWTQMFPSATSPDSMLISLPDSPFFSPFGHVIFLGLGGSVVGKDFGNAPPVTSSTPSLQSSIGTKAESASSKNQLPTTTSEFGEADESSLAVSIESVVWDLIPEVYTQALPISSLQDNETLELSLDADIDLLAAEQVL